MGLSDETESYLVGETDDFTVNVLVRDRSDPDRSAWTVEITTRGHHGPKSTLADVSLEMPSNSARELAPLLREAGRVLATLIEGNADALPDEPPE
jgi:hypothetical protein